jgi:hypothetical protein
MTAAVSALVVLIALAAGSGVALASDLAAPGDVQCVYDANTDTLTVTWSDVAGATKYSVQFVSGFDTSVEPDGIVDITLERSFGVLDTPDAGNTLEVVLGVLEDPGSGLENPIEVSVQIKSMKPPSHRQNSAFSLPVDCGV